MMLFLGSSWADFILDAIQKLMTWASDKAEDLLGWEDSRFDIVAVLNTFKDSYAFVNQAIPFNECLTILLAAFVIKAGIRITRHVIGWIPGVDG